MRDTYWRTFPSHPHTTLQTYKLLQSALCRSGAAARVCALPFVRLWFCHAVVCVHVHVHVCASTTASKIVTLTKQLVSRTCASCTQSTHTHTHTDTHRAHTHTLSLSPTQTHAHTLRCTPYLPHVSDPFGAEFLAYRTSLPVTKRNQTLDTGHQTAQLKSDLRIIIRSRTADD